MAEGIENTQEQKVILKKAKPDSASVAAAQPQVQQAVEQKPVRTIKRKLKPVAHPTANAAPAGAAGNRPAGEQKRRPVVSSTPADSSPQVKKTPEHSAQPSERKSSAYTQGEENRRVQKHSGERTERYDRNRSEKPMRRENTETQSQTQQTQSQSDNKNQIRSLDLSSKRPDRRAGNLAGGSKPMNRFGNQGNRHNKPGFTGGQGRTQQQQDGRGDQNNRGGRPGGYSSDRPRTGGFNKPGFQGGQNRGGAGGRPMSSPMPLETNKQNTKKAFKGKKTYSRKDQESEFFEEKLLQQKKKAKEKVSAVPKSIEMMESISVAELARKMNLKASELIGKLMEMGMMVTMNQSIDADTATILASEYECDVKIVSLYDETIIETVNDEDAELLTRPPVVTIMGHVDHGKTKTLDAIRSTNVTAHEFGGITQHIGAYMVSTPKGNITFLDTPGHEAFTMMRARGAEVTDIVVLVVAADDGVMPQTIEALNHAKDAKVPIIVAINKIDKPEANPDKIKTRLGELGLVAEEWGGDTIYVPISALQKKGIDDLLDAILLQAEVLELKANYSCRAEGKVVESKIDHGRGVVATIIVQRGTLRTGDPYVAGVYSGRVRAIFNDKGEKIDEATPSMPVEILGLEGMPNAGDPFQVTESERMARQISLKRQELKRFEDSRNVKKVTLDNLYETITDGEVLELKVIIKGDVQGSVEALKQSLEKLSTKEIRLNVIHASAGAINDSDVMLAAADSNAIIIGFNVRPTSQAKALAEQEKVDIRKYNVIYKAVEEIQQAMEGMLSPDIKENVIGMAEIRSVIKVPKIGNIAGSYILEGTVKRSSTVHLIRDGIVVFSGKLASLRRFKDDVKEVAAGYECGIALENFNDIKVGDQLEIIETVEVARKLTDTQHYEAPEAHTGNGEAAE
ncbi:MULTISPECIES: translation initiation factor IF-2 [unclassified Treponema]|uniref:translation initiation factor IF-2 n=1 Tax=unclassified Treponema TaxID=2638727 RepID=UPI0005301387|nr:MULTISPECIES: translation initiation factor IF-2 [unclassified Treponema]AIW89914.1 translation initiation factor IF-2 [Treponema sp. OMZ 838]UTC43302.1 translation initiation factor IF-2 [Treponema sp. OMZ 857]UTC50103.1 translation initiation factor IF-2 [Treponema sp. OMZ 855]